MAMVDIALKSRQIKQAVIQRYSQKCPYVLKGVESKPFLVYIFTLCLPLLWEVATAVSGECWGTIKKQIICIHFIFSAMVSQCLPPCLNAYSWQRWYSADVIRYFVSIYPTLRSKYSFCCMCSSWNIKTRIVLLQHITWKWSYDDTTLSVEPNERKNISKQNLTWSILHTFFRSWPYIGAQCVI